MFDKSLEFFEAIGYKKTQDILTKLSIYLHEKLSKLDNVEVFSKPGDFICLINVKGIHPQDVATYLGSKNIYTISGIFCAQYLRNLYSEQSYLRISLGIYNNFSDIDKLVEELKNGGDFYAF
ncbi:Probable cysteine desulfurase [Mycoplasmopsis edwardii]|uniref:Probable cysteine desulfurase n=3 Tax=Mycoplasmopsis edwardii TaxID=53558 RepID=A0A3B0Q4X8_9BACT|nr:Probable cysteine desulfurase [Mycoplasmopsis edwardii]